MKQTYIKKSIYPTLLLLILLGFLPVIASSLGSLAPWEDSNDCYECEGNYWGGTVTLTGTSNISYADACDDARANFDQNQSCEDLRHVLGHSGCNGKSCPPGKYCVPENDYQEVSASPSPSPNSSPMPMPPNLGGWLDASDDDGPCSADDGGIHEGSSEPDGPPIPDEDLGTPCEKTYVCKIPIEVLCSCTCIGPEEFVDVPLPMPSGDPNNSPA